MSAKPRYPSALGSPEELAETLHMIARHLEAGDARDCTAAIHLRKAADTLYEGVAERGALRHELRRS